MGTSVGAFGATGYAGRELARLLGGLDREAGAYLLALPHGQGEARA